jgi:hypothetical protein
MKNNATANSALDPSPVLGNAKIRGVLWRDLCFGHCASEQKGKRGFSPLKPTGMMGLAREGGCFRLSCAPAGTIPAATLDHRTAVDPGGGSRAVIPIREEQCHLLWRIEIGPR